MVITGTSMMFSMYLMKSNLLSMGQLAEKGYEMHIVENKLSIFDKKKVI